VSAAASARTPEPRVVTLATNDTARPGEDFAVSANITPSSNVKWVRLRYRHLTQFEDYLTTEMTLDSGSTHTFRGRIPAAFIDRKWDLMYFVEVMDSNGRGRMYPDLEKETPYRVVSVQR